MFIPFDLDVDLPLTFVVYGLTCGRVMGLLGPCYGYTSCPKCSNPFTTLVTLNSIVMFIDYLFAFRDKCSGPPIAPRWFSNCSLSPVNPRTP